MARFRILAGTHYTGNGTKLKAGAVVESSEDLDLKWRNKFERLDAPTKVQYQEPLAIDKMETMDLPEHQKRKLDRVRGLLPAPVVAHNESAVKRAVREPFESETPEAVKDTLDNLGAAVKKHAEARKAAIEAEEEIPDEVTDNADSPGPKDEVLPIKKKVATIQRARDNRAAAEEEAEPEGKAKGKGETTEEEPAVVKKKAKAKAK